MLDHAVEGLTSCSDLKLVSALHQGNLSHAVAEYIIMTSLKKSEHDWKKILIGQPIENKIIVLFTFFKICKDKLKRCRCWYVLNIFTSNKCERISSLFNAIKML